MNERISHTTEWTGGRSYTEFLRIRRAADGVKLADLLALSDEIVHGVNPGSALEHETLFDGLGIRYEMSPFDDGNITDFYGL